MGMTTPERIRVLVKDALEEAEGIVSEMGGSALKRYYCAVMLRNKLKQATEINQLYIEGEAPYAEEECTLIFEKETENEI